MDDAAPMIARLDLLESRASIADLPYRYAKAVRAGDADGVAALFTADARFKALRQGADPDAAPEVLTDLTGRDALQEFMRKGLKPGQISPLVHDLLIEVRGDEASSHCVMVGAALDGSPLFMGFYEDTYRREGEWRFASRTFTMTGSRNP